MNITTFHQLGLGLVGHMSDHSNTSERHTLCIIMTLITVIGKLATETETKRKRLPANLCVSRSYYKLIKDAKEPK